jgi:hypothetical protein
LTDKDQNLIDKDQNLTDKDQNLIDKDQNLTDKDQNLIDKDQNLTKCGTFCMKVVKSVSKINIFLEGNEILNSIYINLYC